MSDSDQLRLFFALWPDPATRRTLTRATKALVRSAGGRPVSPENLHITLAFLGHVASVRLETLQGLANDIRARPFELVLDRVGFFRRARSLWLGSAEPPPALIALERQLWQSLGAAGWSREPRPFVPHLTLARKAQAPPANMTVKPVSWPAVGFSLLESVTHQSGPVYQEVGSWLFTDG